MHQVHELKLCSALQCFVLAGPSVRSPRNLCIYIMNEDIFGIKASQKYVFLILKRISPLPLSEVFLAEILLRSPRKLGICIIEKNVFRIKVSQNKLVLF